MPPKQASLARVMSVVAVTELDYAFVTPFRAAQLQWRRQPSEPTDRLLDRPRDGRVEVVGRKYLESPSPGASQGESPRKGYESQK